MWWKNDKRTKFGRWLDQEGIQQSDFAERAKVSRSTVWRLCNRKEDYIPTPTIWKKIMTAVKKIDKDKDIHDFFN